MKMKIIYSWWVNLAFHWGCLPEVRRSELTQSTRFGEIWIFTPLLTRENFMKISEKARENLICFAQLALIN